MVAFKSPDSPVALRVTDAASFVFEKALQTPQKTWLIDAITGNKLTFGQAYGKIQSFSGGLRRLGLNKWDVVGIYAPNSIVYPLVVLGTINGGFTITTANPQYTADELAYQLQDSKAKVLLTVKDVLDNAWTAAQKCGIPRDRVFVIGEQVEGFPSAERLFSGSAYRAEFSEKEIKERSAYLCYSSGTTGRSKGVETTHYNMVSNILQIAGVEDVTDNDVWLGLLPMYHIYAMNLSVHCTAFKGISLVVLPKFIPELYLESIQKYRVTMLHIVPPIVLFMAKHPVIDKFDLSCVQKIMSGAAPLSGELTQAVKQRLPSHPIVKQGYGMTETTPVVICQRDDGIVDGSIGQLVPNAEARIVDPETGKDLGINQAGELWVRGPMVMKGYLNNEKATKETIDRDGWLHTGDIAVVDKNGHFFIVDRLKELIKYKGLQVPPAELEAKLLAHPKVSDCAVIGVPDERAGEVAMAFIVPAPDVKFNPQEIIEYIAGQVSEHKRLHGGIRVIKEIPKSAAGKILRRQLRDLVRSKL
ncbi:hypothetical protein EDD86DRAFT_194567 [Gorgonomyces haynaldii]|nr:hypothetical protein EDD86DRAFT_194567 [Gorgonomyces haynaldii]